MTATQELVVPRSIPIILEKLRELEGAYVEKLFCGAESNERVKLVVFLL
jgi:hypothetical protein